MFFRGWRSHEKVVRTGQDQRGEQERKRNAVGTGGFEKKRNEKKKLDKRKQLFKFNTDVGCGPRRVEKSPAPTGKKRRPGSEDAALGPHGRNGARQKRFFRPRFSRHRECLLKGQRSRGGTKKGSKEGIKGGVEGGSELSRPVENNMTA